MLAYSSCRRTRVEYKIFFCLVSLRAGSDVGSPESCETSYSIFQCGSSSTGYRKGECSGADRRRQTLISRAEFLWCGRGKCVFNIAKDRHFVSSASISICQFECHMCNWLRPYSEAQSPGCQMLWYITQSSAYNLTCGWTHLCKSFM